jgi:hypothetical protein
MKGCGDYGANIELLLDKELRLRSRLIGAQIDPCAGPLYVSRYLFLIFGKASIDYRNAVGDRDVGMGITLGTACFKKSEQRDGHLDGLYRYEMVLSRNHTKAEALIQETYVRAI